MGRALAGPEVLETRLTAIWRTGSAGTGITCRRQPVAPGRDNLFAKFESPGLASNLALRRSPGHGPNRWHDHRSVRPADRGRADVGPGILRHQGRDGGHACGRCPALPRAAAPGRLGGAGLHGRRGIHPYGLVATWPDTAHGADLAIVAEPTMLDLVHCHKGALRWKIRTRGVACHSSTPDLGVNAIYRMGRVLDALVEYAGILGCNNARPDCRPAQPLGRPNRGRAERQHRSRLVRDRGRSAT